MDWDEVVHVISQRLGEADNAGEVLVDQQGGDVAVITTGAGTWALSRAVFPEVPAGVGTFDLVEARPAGAVGGFVQPRGFALFSDGELLDVSQRDGMARFWRRAGADNAPILLAELVTAYSPRPPGVGPIQNLIVTLKDIHPHLTDRELEGIADFTELVARDEGGRLVMDFCTYSVGQSDIGSAWRIALSRWRVEAFAGGDVSWSVRPLGGELQSRFYSPKVTGAD